MEATVVVSRYGRPLEFGVFVIPTSDDLGVAREQAAIADELGLDLIGIQDHPYQWRYLETWALIADLLARTERVRFFPDVANLPLRGPSMIAKQAASLDVLSDGRFELGLGRARTGIRSARWAGLCVRAAKPEVSRGKRSRSFASSGAGSARSRSPASTTPSRFAPGPVAGTPDRDLARRRQAAGARPHRAARGRLGAVPLVGHARPRARHAAPNRRGSDRRRRDPSEIRRVLNVNGRIVDGPVAS